MSEHLRLSQGMFIRPVGHYAYCLQVFKITEYPTGKQINFKRWGLRDGQPFNDGHVSAGHFVHGLICACRGVWKEPSIGWCETVYYKQIVAKQIITGQLHLF